MPATAAAFTREAATSTFGANVMRPLRFAILAAACCLAAGAAAAQERTHYLEIVNRANDSAVSLAFAAAGSDEYVEIPLREPLRGGGGSTTVRIPSDGCSHDIRFVFRDGKSMVYRGVDVCRASVVRIRKPPQADVVRLASSQGG